MLARTSTSQKRQSPHVLSLGAAAHMPILCLLLLLACTASRTVGCKSSWYPEERVELVTRNSFFVQVLQVSRSLCEHYRGRGGQTRPKAARDEYMGMGMGYIKMDGEDVKVRVDGRRRRSGREEQGMYHVKVIDARGRGKGERDKRCWVLVGDGDLDRCFSCRERPQTTLV